MTEPAEITNAFVQRASVFRSIVSQLEAFIPWVEMKRTESLKQIDRLLDKVGAAADAGEAVWIEPDDPQGEYEQIPPAEVASGAHILRHHKKMAAAYPDIVMDMTFVYLCAAFDAYFQDYVVSFIASRPTCLKSKRQLAYDKILDELQAGTLLQYLALREAHELGYKPFREQLEYVQNRFGVTFPEEEHLTLLQEAVAIRNLIMHNSGIVNQVFLENLTGHSAYALGERIRITPEYWNQCMAAFTSLTSTLTYDFLCRIHGMEPLAAKEMLVAGLA